jgi:RNA polymerase sigma-70 factor (ECF subfamily)
LGVDRKGFVVAQVDSESDERFIQSFTSCQRALRAFIVGLTPSSADADDILQEVNLALWRKRHLYDQEQEFLRWACAFAVLEIRSFRRRSAKSRLFFDDAALDSLAMDWPYDVSLADQRREALKFCLTKLSTQQLEVITNYYGNRATAQQLAERFERPLSTIYKVLTRAREMLRDCVRSQLSQAEHPA